METDNFLKDAVIQHLLRPPTMPHLLIVMLQALPVRAEAVETGFVDVVDAASSIPPCPSISQTLLPIRHDPFVRLPIPPPSPLFLAQPAIVPQKPPRRKKIGGIKTYTLFAQRVTFLPSRIHSFSPRPYASVLHCM